ncbi:MAG: glycolate oxidase subunit GlcF [Gammaproteobacteria bacterium]|nr:glycolate oxidase subunit GlcF [Gammaproteobacteria bacterium]
MQTQISDQYRNDPQIEEAEAILRKCVHCGFCLATCPTYNLLGDELDSPRGRIYQIKQVLEGHEATTSTLTHLDRCLTCRNCETTCPSGVEYGHLVDIGRRVVEDKVQRPLGERLLRWGLLKFLPYRTRITPLVRLGQWVRPILPAVLSKSIPARRPTTETAAVRNTPLTRRMLVLGGCVQPSLAPETNAAAERVLSRLGIELVELPAAGCCGAINFHLNDQTTALDFMRRNIDAWWPEIENGAEALVMTASGCGSMVSEYGHLLENDADYRDKAATISDRCRDLAEILDNENLAALKVNSEGVGPVAYHPPCTLQHGQKLTGVAERILSQLGFELTAVPDSHTCCGSAGTYSITQKKLSNSLREQKIRNLESGQPEMLVTSNIGCQLHLQSGTQTPVRHWIELLDDACE